MLWISFVKHSYLGFSSSNIRFLFPIHPFNVIAKNSCFTSFLKLALHDCYSQSIMCLIRTIHCFVNVTIDLSYCFWTKYFYLFPQCFPIDCNIFEWNFKKKSLILKSFVYLKRCVAVPSQFQINESENFRRIQQMLYFRLQVVNWLKCYIRIIYSIRKIKIKPTFDIEICLLFVKTLHWVI